MTPMGLYDRDYMRGRPSGPDEEESGSGRLTARRKWLIRVGFILLVAAVVAMVTAR